MTHIDNLNSILAFSLLSHNQAHGRRLVRRDISLKQVQARRATKRDMCFFKRLHDYAVLYFNPLNAMYFTPRVKLLPKAIVGFDASLLLDPGVVFTDGNAASSGTHFFDEVSQLVQLDWGVIKDKFTGYTEDREYRRIKCAEVLVPDSIDTRSIRRIVFDSDRMAQEFESQLGQTGLDLGILRTGRMLCLPRGVQ
jgi:hypothetical protein